MSSPRQKSFHVPRQCTRPVGRSYHACEEHACPPFSPCGISSCLFCPKLLDHTIPVPAEPGLCPNSILHPAENMHHHSNKTCWIQQYSIEDPQRLKMISTINPHHTPWKRAPEELQICWLLRSASSLSPFQMR